MNWASLTRLLQRASESLQRMRLLSSAKGYSWRSRRRRTFRRNWRHLRQGRKTALLTAAIAVAAGVLTSLFALINGHFEGNRDRDSYLYEQRKTVYLAYVDAGSELETKLRFYMVDFDLKFDKSSKLNEAEAISETNKFVAFAAPLYIELEKAEGAQRLVAPPELREEAKKCSKVVGGYIFKIY